MVHVILFILGAIFGFVFAAIGIINMTLGTIVLDKDRSLFIEMNDDEAIKKLTDGRTYVVFKIRRK